MQRKYFLRIPSFFAIQIHCYCEKWKAQPERAFEAHLIFGSLTENSDCSDPLTQASSPLIDFSPVFMDNSIMV